MISNLPIKTLIPAIFMSRFAIIICMLIIGNWFVFIPWKIEEIGLSKKNFGYILLLFGIGSIFSMQATNKLLIPKLGPHFLLPLGVIAFSVMLFLWVSTETALTFALMTVPVGFSFGLSVPAQSLSRLIQNKPPGSTCYRFITHAFQSEACLACLSAAFLHPSPFRRSLCFLR